MTISQLNAAGSEDFVAATGSAFEHSPWIARLAFERRPFASIEDLHAAMVAVVRDSPVERRVALIAAHPDLAGRVAREGRLTTASRDEQTSAGLDRLTPQETARFDSLNRAYRERFGFPFVICARNNTKASILDALEARGRNDRKTEIDAALTEIAEIARLRLRDAVTEK